MLAGVTAIAVVLGLAISAERFLAVWVLAPLVYLAVPTSVVTTALYAHGEVRSILGAAVWLLVMIGVCGIVAAATRRWIEGRSHDP